MIGHPRNSPLFPSTTLFRSPCAAGRLVPEGGGPPRGRRIRLVPRPVRARSRGRGPPRRASDRGGGEGARRRRRRDLPPIPAGGAHAPPRRLAARRLRRTEPRAHPPPPHARGARGGVLRAARFRLDPA